MKNINKVYILYLKIINIFVKNRFNTVNYY